MENRRADSKFKNLFLEVVNTIDKYRNPQTGIWECSIDTEQTARNENMTDMFNKLQNAQEAGWEPTGLMMHMGGDKRK